MASGRGRRSGRKGGVRREVNEAEVRRRRMTGVRVSTATGDLLYAAVRSRASGEIRPVPRPESFRARLLPKGQMAKYFAFGPNFLEVNTALVSCEALHVLQLKLNVNETNCRPIRLNFHGCTIHITLIFYNVHGTSSN